MALSIGECTFAAAPVILAAFLLWRFPAYRRFRVRSLIIYAAIMGTLIYGALSVVAYVASGRVMLREVLVVLWFTFAWRLAWELWSCSVGRWGQRRVHWGRIRRRRGLAVPAAVRLIPLGRALLTACVFFSVFLSMVLTHRCKIADGQDPLSVFQAPFDHVRIPTPDGLVLDGWFIPEKGADRTIVICHGAGANKGNFVWFYGPLSRQGWNVLFFDFRAHGASDGRTTTYGLRERRDVIAAVDWLKRERPAQSRVIVGLGSSQGSMALALAAADDPRIDAVILDSPFVSPLELALHHARRVPVIGPAAARLILAEMSLQTGENFFTASAEQALASFGRRPVMIIHGDQDIGMPASHSQRLYDAATGPKEIWYGPGPHSNIVTTVPDEYARRVFGFLGREGLHRPAALPARRPTTQKNADQQ